MSGKRGTAVREVSEALTRCDGCVQREESGTVWPLAAAGRTSSRNVELVICARVADCLLSVPSLFVPDPGCL